jgi:serine/threonine protein kinase
MELWRYGRAVEQLGQRYRLQGALGSGGMADVCLAWDERDQRRVAIKVIKQDVLDQRHLDRFVKEAAQVAQWRHPHILRFYSDLKLELLDPSNGSIIPYIVMEYAQGGDLHKRLIPGQSYPFNNLLVVFPQLCSAVSYAHKRGIIHRDLKPLNILFRVRPDGEEQAVLSDFGLAVEVSSSHQTFAHGGTLPYMAPEQFQGYVTPASDIFALGVILYLLTTGHLPFRRSLRSMIELRGEAPEGSHEQAVPTIMKPPVPPSHLQPTLSPAFDAVIARALATDPTRRQTDALHLWEEARLALCAPDEQGQRQGGQGEGRQGLRQGGRGQGGQGQAAAPTIPRRGQDSRGSGLPLPLPPSLSTPAPRATSLSTSRPSAPLPKTSPARIPRLVLPVALLLLLVGVSLTYTYLPVVHNILPPAAMPLFSNAVDVTITPTSHTLSQVYPLTAVIGNADPAQMQVQARIATSPAQTQQKPANATGTRKTAGAQAKGMLTFLNGSFKNPFTLNAGYSIVGADGTPVVTDSAVVIPIAKPGVGDGQANVSAHVVTAGSTGNIAALDINHVCCISDNSVFVKNLSAFAGGQDPKNYMFVQQSDVDAVASPLKGSLSQQGLMALRRQIAPNEQPIGALSAGACTPNVTSDQPIGDTGANISSTNVTVSVTCNIEVYDSAAAKAIAARQLTTYAASTLGNGYAPKDSRAMRTDITIQGIDQQRTVALRVQARGTWVYRFSDDQRQSIARYLAGKSRAAALALLRQMIGINSASIPTSITSLPGDAGRINIVISG